MKAPDYFLAKAVESSVFQTSMLAYSLKDSDPEQSNKWMRHADKMEKSTPTNMENTIQKRLSDVYSETPEAEEWL